MLAIARQPELDLAVALAQEADRPRAWYGLEATDPGPLRLIVVRGAPALDTLAGGRMPRWGAGFAAPGVRTIVVRADGGDPHRILRHELAHLALHAAVRTRVPLWFDEGYAAVAAGEIGRLGNLRLSLAVARGRLPTLDEVDRALRGTEAGADAGYALASSAVLFLARGHPSGELAPLLGRLRRGEGFASAVLATTGLTLGRFEVVWQRDVRRRYGWVVWLSAGGFWVLVAILVLGAAYARWRRDLPRRAALDEGWEVPDGPDSGAPEEPTRLDPGQSEP